MHYYFEIVRDSREFTITASTFQQKIVVQVKLDPSIVPVNSNLGMNGQYDDIAALEYAYTLFSGFRAFPSYYNQVLVCVLDNIVAKDVGPNTWRFEATYKYDANSGTGGENPGEDDTTLPYIKYGFTIGQGTKLIKRSLSSTTPVLSTESKLAGPLDFMGAINVNDTTINGTEIPDAQFKLQITAYYFPQFVTMAFGNLIADLINGPRGYGTHNNATFLTRPAGEVQLLSASGGGTVVDIVPITFEFSLKKNVTALTDPGFADLTMLGHEIVDYYWRQDVDLPKGSIRLIADQRVVHTITEPVDYTLLNFPTRSQYETP